MKSPNRHFKAAIYEQFVRIGKAVSSLKRLELLDLICQGEKTVEALSRETGLTVANTSQHLQKPKAARLIKAEKEGLYVKYHLADEVVCAFFRPMRILAEHRFLDRQAQEQSDLRIVDQMPPDQFLNHLTRLMESERIE